MTSEKVTRTHTERQAVVYPRQSTLKQIAEHKESLARQYALKQRAQGLGWHEEKVVVIDEDLGISGASAEWRPGFQKLAENVAHGRVGGIFALEVSRLARSSADWHKLLELCALADVVICDEQAVYNPRDYNDRLLLGLKGTMSEAELYWMRLRLDGARISKARRGELYYCPPAGYEWDRDIQRFRMDANDEVRRAVNLVFERFRIDGSAYAVTRYFGRMGLQIPSRDIESKKVHWVSPRKTLVLGILHNPIYAGTYAYGRKEGRMGLVDGKLKKRVVRTLSQESWKSVIHNHHPAYISWEEFMSNEKKIKENRPHEFYGENRGAAREGSALLQGLALCGRCGHRMGVRYQGKSRRPQYNCGLNDLSHQAYCWDVAGAVIEQAVVKQFLTAVIPSDVELALSVATETERQIVDIDKQWNLRLERLQYEAKLAERRYKAIDPDNRVVARTLEREWEEKLRELEKTKQEKDDVRNNEKLELTKEQRSKIVSLSKDLKSIWNAQTTTYAERKNLLRILIREVTLTPIDVPARQTKVAIWWQTGAVSEIIVPRKDKFEALSTPPETVKLVKEFFEKKYTDEQIAAALTNLNVARRSTEPWDGHAVRRVRYGHGFYHSTHASRRTKNKSPDGLYSKHGVAEKLGVPPGVVNCWALAGILKYEQGGGTTRARWFRLDEETLNRLKIEKAKRFK